MNGKQLTKYYAKQTNEWLLNKIDELKTNLKSEVPLLESFYRDQIFIAKRELKTRGVAAE
jgi:hypothetical protein